MPYRSRFAAGAVIALLSAPAVSSALDLVPVVDAIGHQRGDGISPADGSLIRLINGAGLTKPNLENIATWTHNTSWQDGWQGGGANTLTGNVGWLVLDLGSTTSNLDDLYLWNVNEQFNPLQRGIQTFKLWFSLDPVIDPPASGGGAQNYDFSTAGGWLQLGSTFNLAQGLGNSSQTYSGVFDLSGVPAARYIGIEAITNYGSGTGGTDTVNRTGLAEVVITAVPEPAAATILFSSLAFFLAPRRRSR